MTLPGARLVLFDVDGVLRHYDRTRATAIERSERLAPGTIERAAFDRELLRRLTTGLISRKEWVEEIGRAIGSTEAARYWASSGGCLDRRVLDIVAAVRRGGTGTGILSNGSDELRSELSELGVLDHFDFVANSAEIGFAKPDREAFDYVCLFSGVEPEEVIFIDDTVANVEGAEAVGMTALHFRGAGHLLRELRGLGVLVGAPLADGCVVDLGGVDPTNEEVR